ncbi:MAG: extracellular solute-binding protein, partial [Thermodesulfobacteriota bacterium]|nr:extracellular solute-binding protein [Thermodesulfobacteriota bacterium]
MKRKWWALMVGFLMVAFLSGSVLAQEKVVVYTSLETDEVAEYLKLARKELPDLDIHIIRLSTGELGARMLAEKDNPQADCIWGWAVTNLEDFVTKGMVEPYKPKGVEKLEKRFVHPKYYYVGIDMYIAAFCVNTKVMKEKDLPMPKGWNDLLDPKFKGLIAMPNPVASGTGFLQVSSILQMYGAKGGESELVAKIKASGILKKGSKGDVVVALQKSLNQLGLKAGAEDGIFGPSTLSAVVNFQKAEGIGADGVVGTITKEKLAKKIPPTEAKEDGWEFLKKLDKNMGQYIKSGSRPAKMTAAGEFAVGASFDFVVAEQKKQGFPVEFVFPIEGAGYEVEANALL